MKMLIHVTHEPHHIFCSKFAKPLRSFGHHVLFTTLEPFACARQIKIARSLHDPGTEYCIIYVYHFL